MNFTIEQIEELKALCSGVQVHKEAGIDYIYLSGLKLPKGCTPNKVDALLCPVPRDGYPTRLFFSEKVRTSVSRNWNGLTRILERNWYAFSWKHEQGDLSLIQMVSIHLRGLKG